MVSFQTRKKSAQNTCIKLQVMIVTWLECHSSVVTLYKKESAFGE